MERKKSATRKKTAVGRPKLPEEMRKTNFTIGVTPELRDAIGALAGESEMSASAWACAALTKAVAQDMVFAEPTREESVESAVKDTRRVLRVLLAMRNGAE